MLLRAANGCQDRRGSEAKRSLAKLSEVSQKCCQNTNLSLAKRSLAKRSVAHWKWLKKFQLVIQLRENFRCFQPDKLFLSIQMCTTSIKIKWALILSIKCLQVERTYRFGTFFLPLRLPSESHPNKGQQRKQNQQLASSLQVYAFMLLYPSLSNINAIDKCT